MELSPYAWEPRERYIESYNYMLYATILNQKGETANDVEDKALQSVNRLLTKRMTTTTQVMKGYEV
jgi:hypothetical protein